MITFFREAKFKKVLLYIISSFLFIFFTYIVYKGIFINSNKQYKIVTDFDAGGVYDLINDDAVLEQSFVCAENNFSGFSVKFYDFSRRIESDILISLRKAGESADLYSWKASTLGLKSNQYNDFHFEPIAASAGQEYVIVIRYYKVDGEKLMAPMYNSNSKVYPGGKFKVNGGIKPGVIGFRQLFYNPVAGRIFSSGMAIYIAAAVILLIVIFAKRRSMDDIFLPVMLVLGIIYIFSTPPFRAQDEDVHFYRAYEVAQGHSVSDIFNGIGGRMLPSSLKDSVRPGVTSIKYEDTINAMDIKLDPDTREFIKFPTSALYSPVAYYPQALGIIIAEKLGLSPIWMVYFGRICTLLVWAFLMNLAMQIFFFGKRMMFLLALTPMSLFTVASLSADALTNAFSFMYISFVLYLTCGREKRISLAQIIFLLILCVGISLCKIVYIPLCLICFMIPREKLGSRLRYWCVMGGIMLISFGANLWWLNIASRFSIDHINIGTSTPLQLKGMLDEPLSFIITAIHTLFYYGNFFVQSFVGASLGWFDIPIYTWISTVYTLILGFVVVADNSYRISISTRNKGIMLFVVASISVLICASLYVVWTRVGAPIVEGIQGRYFTPIVLLALMLFSNAKVRNNFQEEDLNLYLSTAVVLMHLPVLATILIHHI